MKNVFLLVFMLIASASCYQDATSGNTESLSNSDSFQGDTNTVSKAIRSQDVHYFHEYFSKPDADKILGEPSHLSDSSTTHNADVSIYRCSYISDEKDPKSGKTGAIYYLLEKYTQLSSAQNKYTSIKKANEDHGIKVLHDLGDEAYFHSDNENFYFIMARKDHIVLTMKVNKITSTTSLENFNSVAKNIIAEF